MPSTRGVANVGWVQTAALYVALNEDRERRGMTWDQARYLAEPADTASDWLTI